MSAYSYYQGWVQYPSRRERQDVTFELQENGVIHNSRFIGQEEDVEIFPSDPTILKIPYGYYRNFPIEHIISDAENVRIASATVNQSFTGTRITATNVENVDLEEWAVENGYESLPTLQDLTELTELQLEICKDFINNHVSQQISH